MLLKRKIIILCTLIFCIMIAFFAFNRTNQVNINDTISYFVEGDDGYTKSSSIPTGSYQINEDKTNCLSNGVISSYDNENGTIRYRINGSDKCSIYFDKTPDLGQMVNVNLNNVQINGSNENMVISIGYRTLTHKLLTDKSTAFNETTGTGLVKDVIYGNMFRYQGNEFISSVKNYVCFGYNEVSDCTGANKDDFLYRVIGIDKDTNQTQIIKASAIKEGSNTAFTYHREPAQTDWGSAMDKTQADISIRLNGQITSEMGNTVYYDYYGGQYNLSNIFVNSAQYPYMAQNSDWYNKISDHAWKSGIISGTSVRCISSSCSVTGNSAYELEESFTRTSLMKIGILNASDVFYANTTGAPLTYSNNAGSWLYTDVSSANSYEWTSIRYDQYSSWVLSGYNSTKGYYNTGDIDIAYRVRPTFFLNSEVLLLDGGNGSQTDPFIIAL